jgi:PAS domain S-box-containing protein
LSVIALRIFRHQLILGDEMDQKPGYLPQGPNESMFKNILDAVDQAILLVDENGLIISANQSARVVFESERDVIVGKSIGEIISQPSIIEIVRDKSKMLSPRDRWSGNFLCNLPNGKNSWLQLIVFQIFSTEGKLYCLIAGHSVWLARLQAQVNKIMVELSQPGRYDAEVSEQLAHIAQLFIPEIADGSAVHMLDDEGSFECVSITPHEMADKQALYEWFENDLPNDESDGLPRVLQSRKPVLINSVNPVRRAASAGIKSYLVVPLFFQQSLIGTITLISAGSGRQFDQEHLLIIENLAIHITAYLQFSRLLLQNQQLKTELEKHNDSEPKELHEALVQLKLSEETNQNLFRISNKLNATLDVETILGTLAQEAIQMVDGESGFAGLKTNAGMEVRKYYEHGEEISFDHVWALGEGIPGWVLKYKVPYGTVDAENDPLINHDLPINADIHSIICTPILDSAGEVIAYFDIRNKKGAEGFSINDQEMLLMLAPVASIAIQNAIRYQERLVTVAKLETSTKQLEDLAASLENAREEERTQIARELHDQLGQSLAAMKFDLSSLTEHLSQKDEDLAQKTKDIIAQLNNLIKMVRRIATQLRPGMLDDLGLVPSIEWLVKDFEKRSGISCNLDLPEIDVDLSKEQSLAIYRIFQEALTNIGLHSDAHNIDVYLKNKGNTLILELHDDGQGIKENEIFGSDSLGLLGMRERARHLGGAFEIHGTEGQGTAIKVSIPLKSN